MLSLITTLTFSQAVDSLYREFGDVVKEKVVYEYMAKYALEPEMAKKVAFVELLFSADSGVLGIQYVDNSSKGIYKNPLYVLPHLGARREGLDCDEIVPIGAAALNALGVRAKVGFYHNHAVVVVEREDRTLVVDLSFPAASLYSVKKGAFSYRGMFYDSLSYKWMKELDRRYADSFAPHVARLPRRVEDVVVPEETFRRWRKILKAVGKAGGRR